MTKIHINHASVRLDLGGAAFAEQLALMQHRYFVSDALDKIHVVFDHHHRFALRNAAQQIASLFAFAVFVYVVPPSRADIASLAMAIAC